jgi:hypothetical protein
MEREVGRMNNCKVLSRAEMEQEISSMIKKILLMDDSIDDEVLLVGDCYCRFDVLFEK